MMRKVQEAISDAVLGEMTPKDYADFLAAFAAIRGQIAALQKVILR
jgi:hypothetical protein